jgi:hypothetical protein
MSSISRNGFHFTIALINISFLIFKFGRITLIVTAATLSAYHGARGQLFRAIHPDDRKKQLYLSTENAKPIYAQNWLFYRYSAASPGPTPWVKCSKWHCRVCQFFSTITSLAAPGARLFTQQSLATAVNA